MVYYVASQLTSSLNLLSILVTNIRHYSYSTLYTFFSKFPRHGKELHTEHSLLVEQKNIHDLFKNPKQMG